MEAQKNTKLSIRKSIAIVIVSLIGWASAGNATAQVVCVTKLAKEANVKVYETNYANDADIVVYKTAFVKNTLKNDGNWHFTSNCAEATKVIRYMPSKAEADIVICFTTDSKAAGWKNKKKQYLMK